MKRLVYLSHMNIRSHRGHVHNIIKTCEALASVGVEVTLVSTDTSPSAEELAQIYVAHGVTTPFHPIFLGTVPFGQIMQVSRVRRSWAMVKALASLMRYVWQRRTTMDVLYYRYHPFYPVAWFVKHVMRKPVFFESHYVYINDRRQQWLTEKSVQSADGVIAITHALCRAYNLAPERCVMSPCFAVETEHAPHEDPSTLRKSLDLPSDAFLLCYTGSLGATIQGISYEVETMIDLLPSLDANVRSVIVGGKGDEAEQALRDRAEKCGVADRVIIRPWCDRTKLMQYLTASDILMMPRVGTAPGSSPAKMFDYLAVGKPIIAAETPPVVEVLHDQENALLVDADKPEEWITAIKRIGSDSALATRLIQGAHETAAKYTWTERGRTISAFIDRQSAIRQ